jgi:hypothetical protein
VGAALLAVVLAGCGRERPASESTEVQRGAVQAQPSNTDPCTWIPAAEVERLVGKLEGTPRRGKSAENPEPSRDGRACVYTLATRESATDDASEVAIQVDMEDATTFETGFGMAMDALARDVGRSTTEGAAGSPNSTPPDKPWDFTGGLPGMYVGRLGHMAVIIGYRTYLTIPEGVAERLAAAVRDRVPDLPMAAPRADPNARGGSPDPCSLISREQAEQVLGKLAVAPYRSRESTPLADGRGESCSYYRGRHRVLVLTPTWSDGKEAFQFSAGFTQRVTSTLGVGQQAADTLDGPWDQASSALDGELYFLKGDRMLAVQYRTAGVDETAATRLATLAMKQF